MSGPACPDCGCALGEHVAVSRVGRGRVIPLCGSHGECWLAGGSSFVEELRNDLIERSLRE